MATKKKAIRRQTRALYVEGLEQRMLLAGDVVADLLLDGTLQIVGDHLDNKISVSSPTVDVIEVAGRFDTTVNGDDSAQFAQADVVDIVIEMEHGHDGVAVRDVDVSGDMRVDLGAWNNAARGDTMLIENVKTGGDLVALGQQGRQRIQVLGAMVNGDLVVDAGTGTDETVISIVTVAGDVIVLGQNSDEVYLRNMDIGGDVVVSLGDSDSHVNLYSIRAGGNVAIETGSGDDVIRTNSIRVAGDLSIDTGQGSDFVRFNYDHITGNVAVDTAQGKDAVVFDDILFVGGDATFRGGNGDDLLLWFLVECDGTISVDGFETIA
jgi:hypothetical protein